MRFLFVEFSLGFLVGGLGLDQGSDHFLSFLNKLDFDQLLFLNGGDDLLLHELLRHFGLCFFAGLRDTLLVHAQVLKAQLKQFDFSLNIPS